MNNIDVRYLSRLIEPQIQKTCRWTEEELKVHLKLGQETAHQVIMQALRNIVGRDIRWNQPLQQPAKLNYQKTNYRNYHVYSDSDLSVPVTEISVE